MMLVVTTDEPRVVPVGLERVSEKVSVPSTRRSCVEAMETLMMSWN